LLMSSIGWSKLSPWLRLRMKREGRLVIVDNHHSLSGS
jgi:hypothetical protein